MFTLTCATDNLLLTRKRCGLVVDKSIFAGINVNDEIVEINHFRVESLTDGALQQQLSLPMISLLILLNDEEQIKQQQKGSKCPENETKFLFFFILMNLNY